jgi:hypothetical protein
MRTEAHLHMPAEALPGYASTRLNTNNEVW